MMNKRAISFGDIPAVVILFVVAGVTLAIGATIAGNMKTNVDVCSTWTNTTGGSGGSMTNCTSSVVNNTIDSTIDGYREFANWQETIAIVIAAAVIMGLLGLFFKGRDAF